MLPLVQVFGCDAWGWCSHSVTRTGASLVAKQDTERPRQENHREAEAGVPVCFLGSRPKLFPSSVRTHFLLA